jgi:hypothetical protein
MLVLAYLFVTRLTYEYNSEAAAAAALKVSRQFLVTLRKLAAKNNPSERRKVRGRFSGLPTPSATGSPRPCPELRGR